MVLSRVALNVLRKAQPLCIRWNHATLLKRQSVMKIIVDKARKDIVQTLNRLENEISELNSLKKDSDENFLKAIDEEVRCVEEQFQSLQKSALETIADDDGADIHDSIIEITQGIGGQEAMLFAQELCEVYQNYAAFRGWQAHLLEADASDIGGVRTAVLEVKGQSSYKWLRHEGGVHRVQRVPATEKAGRIHTSTVTVAVLPISESDDIKLSKKDLIIETKRSSGPGGQNVNKLETCVRIVHIPTKLATECQETRSQDINKERAMQKLRQMLLIREARAKQQQEEVLRKQQVSSADRSDKIRTYNFAQDRITDHRLHHTTHGLREFMTNDPQKLDGIIALLQESYVDRYVKELLNES